MNIQALRRQVVVYCRLLWDKGWVANHDGNITVRIGPNRILATPTAMSKREIREDDLLILDIDTGKVLTGSRKPFSELYLHTEAYKVRDDVQTVIHAHPRTLCSFSVAGIEVEPRIMPEPVVSIGERIPLTPPVMPGSPQAREQIRALARLYDVILLGNHGPVSFGTDLEQAFLRLELAEHVASIQQQATWLGRMNLIPEVHLKDLLKARKKAGLGPEARGVKVPPELSPANAAIPDLVKALVEKL